MLKSYQYTEKPITDFTMQNNLFHMKEVDIAHRYVESNSINSRMDKTCPICGDAIGDYFFTKWGVDYIRCRKCQSIYAVYDEDIIDGYLHNEELISFRLSPDYQEQITKSRSLQWNDFLEWVQIRSNRFMGRFKDLNVLDVGNRYKGFVDAIRESKLCGKYRLIDSIYDVKSDDIGEKEADVIFYNDVFKTETRPNEIMEYLKGYLKDDGIIIFGARAGSGFDVLTLKGSNTNIYPYEHILLPSVEGLRYFFKRNGFELLEITTPGVMDVHYVLEDAEKISNREEFVKALFREKNEATLQEFQRFLQKNGMSSFVRLIARKVV